MFGGGLRATLAGKEIFPMNARPALTHLRPGQGKSVPLGKVRLSFKAGAIVGSSYAVAELTLPPGAANPPHSHPAEETMYVLEGALEMVGENGERTPAGPGSVTHVPPHAAHGFVNVGRTPARLLLVSPAAQEAYFDDLSEALACAKHDPEAVAAVRARHGIVSVGSAAGGR
jgi:quercetin dioxygenase-like cupin family protein